MLYLKTTSTTASASSFNNALPDIYAGHPNRIQRYYQYNDMSLDSDIALALDMIADFALNRKNRHNAHFWLIIPALFKKQKQKLSESSWKNGSRKMISKKDYGIFSWNNKKTEILSFCDPKQANGYERSLIIIPSSWFV